MSANFGNEGSGSQDFDLNLAPIIDCLTVLITFMLASASFLSIGILDAGVAAGGAAADNSAPPPINISVELGNDHRFVIKTSGKETSSTPVASEKADWNFAGLTHDLEGLKSRWPTVNAVTLTADNQIQYQNVVKAMEVIRKTMPVVLLGGF